MTYKGKIRRLIRDRGFGFISCIDGRGMFFHQNSLADIKFDDLNEGQDVEFEVEKSFKGPRVVSVHVSR